MGRENSINGAASAGLNGTGNFLKSEVGRQLTERLEQAKGRGGAPHGEGEIDPPKRGPGRPRKAEFDAEAPVVEPKRRGRPPKSSYEDLMRPVEEGEVPETVEEVKIPPLNIRLATVTVKSITPLIVHKFSEKSRKEIEAKQQGAARHKKDAKIPENEYQGCFYFMPDGKTYAVPASAFKKAMISACRYADLKMSLAKGAFHILGDLLPLKATKPWMRTDICRVGNFGSKVADIRYRPQFDEWSVDLTFRYNASAISLGELANLINIAGFGVGVFEWRPEKDGSFGMFEVAETVEPEDHKRSGKGK
jgi:hypothetical protein